MRQNGHLEKWQRGGEEQREALSQIAARTLEENIKNGEEEEEVRWNTSPGRAKARECGNVRSS